MLVTHPFNPLFFEDSKVLILGSIPSVKSREQGFYYAHPQNKFWWVLETLYQEKIENNLNSKINFLKKNKIALFDVVKQCEISSSSDTTIKNVIPNDLSPILNNSQITTIFTTGKKAFNLYEKYCYNETKIHAIPLPSTSPANCPKNIKEILLETYSQIKEITDN